jgi:ribose transport system permease protein
MSSSTSDMPRPMKGAKDKRSPGSSVGELFERLGRLGLVVILAIVLVGFSLWKSDAFGTWVNYRTTLDQQVPVLIVALAVMIPLIVGEFDLSVGANLSLSNVFVVGLVTQDHWGIVPAIVIAIALSTLVGFFNGVIVMRFQINAFVTTLATGTIIGGIALAYAHSQDLFGAPGSLTSLGRTSVAGLPISVVYAIVIVVVLILVLNFLPVGRKMRAIGGNRRAAELNGIAPFRYVVGSFVTGGFLAGIGGVVLGAQTGSAATSASGALLLPAFAAAFLGATTIEPGRFNVIGTVVAVYFLAFTVTGLQIVGVQSWVQPVINGAALLAAVALSSWALRLRVTRLRREQLIAIEQAE